MTWQKSDLSELIEVIESGGRPHGGASQDSGEIPSLGGENIRLSGGIEVDEVKKVPTSFFERLAKGKLQNQDVLINKDGANTGKVGLYENQFPKASINEHVFLLRGKQHKLEQTYLYYMLLSQSGQDIIRSKISGTAQPGLKRDFIESFPVSVPVSTQEQSKIAEVLSTIDRAIAQTEALIAKHQRIKTGLMQDLLTRGIDEHGQLRDESTHKFKSTPLGMIPVEWEVYRMEDLTVQIVDGTHFTPNYVESGIPFVTIKNLTGSNRIDLSDINYITEKDHKELIKRVKPRAGDVLVTKDGTLGVSRIIENNFPEFSIFVSVALLRPNTKVTSYWLWLFFESGKFEKQLGQLSAGTGLKHIHLEHFKAFMLATPSLEEQNRIMEAINTIQTKIITCIKQLDKLRALKAGLMQDLLSGEVSVTPLMEGWNPVNPDSQMQTKEEFDILLSETQKENLLIIQGNEQKIVIGVPHHAPLGVSELPCPEHRDADENTGFLGAEVARLLDCNCVIACNATKDPNKNKETDYSQQISSWKPELLIEIHGHRDGSTSSDIEISSGIVHRNNWSLDLEERLKKKMSAVPLLKDFTISGNFGKIKLKATKSYTITAKEWVALHIELPKTLRQAPEVYLPFCKILAESVSELMEGEKL